MSQEKADNLQEGQDDRRVVEAETQPEARNGSALLDPGWLLLIPGIVLVGLTILLPAKEDLAESRFYRDRLLAVEKHRTDRLSNHHEYLQQLRKGDEATVLSLAAVQLNKAPEGKELLVPPGEIGSTTASVFDRLEPEALVLEERVVEPSTLQKLASDPTSRIWLLIAGSTLILMGLLPGSRSR